MMVKANKGCDKPELVFQLCHMGDSMHPNITKPQFLHLSNGW